MRAFFIIIIVVLLVNSCKNCNKTKMAVIKTDSIFQSSFSHGGLGIDTVVLSNAGKNVTDFYNTISIFRNGKRIFFFEDKSLEIVANPNNIFKEQDIETYKSYFYIFELFGGFQPSKFLVLRTSKDSTIIFGKTEMNSALIFNDIDFDGIFEIGGFMDNCEEYKNHPCPDSSLFVVFEIRDGFPIDTKLTSYFRGLLMEKK